MNKYPNLVKRKLYQCINDLEKSKDEYVERPGKDFSRNRSITFSQLIEFLVRMGTGSLSKEILKFFDYSNDTPSGSALCQVRGKLKPQALQALLQDFSKSLKRSKKFKGHNLIAVDGTTIIIPTNPDDPTTYFKGSDKKHDGSNGLKAIALYDIYNKQYLDAEIQGYREDNENAALLTMLDRTLLSIESILICDRRYESYNNIAVLGLKGFKYLIRVKSPKSKCGLLHKCKLPLDKEFDEMITLKMTRKLIPECTKEPETYRCVPTARRFDLLPPGTREIYNLTFRVVCIKHSKEKYQYFITNLDESFTLEDIKIIYKARWGIETSFRELKHTIGLLQYNSKKKEYIIQEIFAKMVLYNFCEAITVNIIIEQDKDKKYLYQIHFKNAISICIEYLTRYRQMRKVDIEELIKKYILPIKIGRHFKRKVDTQPCCSYIYRPA